MRKTYRIINLVKKAQLYTNQALEQALAKFNQEQDYLYLELTHYDLDNFVLRMQNNQLQIAYLPPSNQRVVYKHPEDQYAASLQTSQEVSELIYFTPANVDLVLARFGPQFNHNGFALVQAFTNLGISVTNSIQGLRNCRDKWYSYLQLTDIVPLVNSSFTTWKQYLNLPDDLLVFPQISKPNASTMGGQNLHLAYNQPQLAQNTLALHPYDFTLTQEYIQSYDLRNYDLRIMVLNGQVTGAFLRVSQEDKIVANIAQGGYGVAYQITPELEQQALAIAQRLDLELCGLDFIYNHQYQQWQFLEANANPGFFAYDKVLKQEFAQNILDYLLIRLTGHNRHYFINHHLTETDLTKLHPLSKEQALIWQQAYKQELQNQQQVQVDFAIAQATAQQLKEQLIAQGVQNAEELVASHTGISLQSANAHYDPSQVAMQLPTLTPAEQKQANYQKLTANLSSEKTQQLQPLLKDLAQDAAQAGVSLQQSTPTIMHQEAQKQATQALALETARMQAELSSQEQAQAQADKVAQSLLTHLESEDNFSQLDPQSLAHKVQDLVSAEEKLLHLDPASRQLASHKASSNLVTTAREAQANLTIPPLKVETQELGESSLPKIETDTSQLIFAPDPSLIALKVERQKQLIEKEQREKITSQVEVKPRGAEELNVVTFAQKGLEASGSPVALAYALNSTTSAQTNLTTLTQAVGEVLTQVANTSNKQELAQALVADIWQFPEVEAQNLPRTPLAVPSLFATQALEQTATQPTDATQFDYAAFMANSSTLLGVNASVQASLKHGENQEAIITQANASAGRINPLNNFACAQDNPTDLVRITEKQLNLLRAKQELK
ncbi:ATP-grasp domain-containing protein [Psittacicella gerlachiana]|uniref:ATP-grasp domain-containing protein n=1 Tax=Psittacicella gerlachiana TaxID=2028574 RepID=A0A3A1YIK2_9GAMM|nr:hypothetical protein [Psittacicella gerlachiana]RIY35847.1 hypothetical protein CKF59_03220 [Psittacicella gerlachiana]